MDGEDEEEEGGDGRDEEEEGDGMEVDGDEDVDMGFTDAAPRRRMRMIPSPGATGIFPDTGLKIPTTPGRHHKRSTHNWKPGSHWLMKPIVKLENLPIYEDLKQRVRLDWLIMFDLRMWKKARVDLRELYIGTVVAIPQFKRILGLRFAGLYTTLSQLYLIADREPDHSIINLSLQMLTTPSITSEVVSRGNFLTNLMAILYTFLTTRQVGHLIDVNPEATLAFDAGSLTNRRMYHFFQDMRYLFASDFVRERLKTDYASMLQFLDLVRLHQGICPNVRAVATHVEYESDAWICASLITREINKLSRQFADAFKNPNARVDDYLTHAIQVVSKSAIKNSLGLERDRFTQAEVKELASFHEIGDFEMDTDKKGKPKRYRVIEYHVDRQPMSFHHAMHYALSWLIEVGKGMPASRLQELMSSASSEIGRRTFDYEFEDDIIAMFDYPLRVFVWLSQMKAGMWVRNGFSLRHQMNTYKGVSQRDLTFYRDIFMLQVAMVVVDPNRMLATILDRFDLVDWFRGCYSVVEGKENVQTLDLAEDLIHLLIVLLSDRLLLLSAQDEKDIPTLQLQREIAHVLCTGSSSFSDISQKIPERLQELENFQEVLAEMTNFKPPDGLNDTGMYELKSIFKEDIDPYILQFSKNQKEEAENMYKQHMAKKLRIPEAEVVFELRLRPIRSGIFTGIANFTKTALFVQIIYYALSFGVTFKEAMPDAPESRLEAFIHVVLHLVQLAIAEDDTVEGQQDANSFVLHALETESCCVNEKINSLLELSHTIIQILYKLKSIENYKSCVPKIDHILQKLREKRPNAFAANSVLAMETDEGVDDELIRQQQLEEEAAKKKALAKQRQANIMAQFQAQQQSFLNNLGLEFDSDDLVDSPGESAMDEDKFEENAHPAWNFPTGNCILCQEETNDTRIYGTFALIKDSSILRQTSLYDPDYVHEVAITPDSLDRSAEHLRPFGVAGMNRDTLKKLAEDGTELLMKRQGLGKGYPQAAHLMRKGPVAVSCGHLMHFHCFEHYYMATQRRHAHQISRQHPERLDKKEFICPLCRALGNAFLPIVWKPKEEKSVDVMVSTETAFDTWLTQEIGPTISRLQKAAVTGDKSSFAKYKEQFFTYGSTAFIDKIASKLNQVAEPTFTHKHLTSESSGQSQPTIILPVGGGGFETQLSLTLAVTPQPPLRGRLERPVTDLEEMDGIYRRLRDTLILNRIFSKFSRPKAVNSVVKENELSCVDTLIGTLGFTISATEIGLRGVESEAGSTFLDKVSQQNLTHLRILAETIQAYICIGGLQDDDTTATIFGKMHKDQMFQLFFGHPQIYDSQRSLIQDFETMPLLSEDIFIFLSNASLCLCPALNIDFKYILNLCYIAEIVKVILAISIETVENSDRPGWGKPVNN